MAQTSVLGSKNGVTWTAVTTPWDTDAGATGDFVGWNGSLLVATAFFTITTHVIQTSPDGENWTGRASPIDAQNTGEAVWWCPASSLWIVGSGTSGPSQPNIVTSPDGISWTTRHNATNSGDVNVFVSLGKTVVAGCDNAAFFDTAANQNTPLGRSTDGGVTWSPVPLANHPFGRSGSVSGLATDGHTIVAVGLSASGGPSTPTIATSTDGLSWTAGTLPANFIPSYVVFGQGFWVLSGKNVGLTASVATSTTPGSGYTAVSTPFDSVSIFSIAYSPDREQWVATAGASNSKELITANNPNGPWVTQTTPVDSASDAYSGLVWAGDPLNLWVVVGIGQPAPSGLWLFPSPQIIRIRRPLESEPVFSLWTRVKRDIPTTLIQLQAGTWEEWPDVWPSTRNPRNKFFFSQTNGDGGCFNTMGSDQSGFVTPKRLYIGGHVYVISDALKAELHAAVTTAAPTGYDSFIVAAPPGSVYTGDEIILSGFDEGHKPAPV